MTDQMPPPTRTEVAVMHEHDWQGQGFISSPNGDTIPALCGCGATRRFAVRDEATYVDEDGVGTTTYAGSTAIFDSDQRRRAARPRSSRG